MEDLRRKYSWWPNGGGREGQHAPLIDVEAGEEDCAALRGVKSTKCSNVNNNIGDIAKGECKRAYGLGSQCHPN